MPGLRSYKPLKLEAIDAEDVKVMSACLQDAVAKLGDFVYQAEQRRFAFVANRFLWECAGDARKGPFGRVRAGCHFDDVIRVRSINIRRDAPSAIVDILAIRFEPAEEGTGTLVLELAGGGAISLDVEAINGHLKDISEPWRTRSRPDHSD